MTDRSTTHASFTLSRDLPHPPERVWRAYAVTEERRKWFVDSGGATTFGYALDFRDGGAERWHGNFGPHEDIVMQARFMDLVVNRRIVTAYQMHIAGNRISVSLQTTELEPAGSGTRLKLTEYGAYLDGHDTPEARQTGTEWLLDNLAAHLDQEG